MSKFSTKLKKKSSFDFYKPVQYFIRHGIFAHERQACLLFLIDYDYFICVNVKAGARLCYVVENDHVHIFVFQFFLCFFEFGTCLGSEPYNKEARFFLPCR